MLLKGLAPKTAQIFEAISRLECIKPFTLVGGTALSLQINARLSEDLDFMSWRKTRGEKREVNWPQILQELQTVGEVERYDIYGLDHVEFIVSGVKISFYANPNYSPVREEKTILENIKVADLTSLGAMKMEVMLRRSKFRDYYDIYTLLENGNNLKEMIELALKYSGYRLKSKNLLAMLSNSDRFVPDTNFAALQPIHNISPKKIEERIKSAIQHLTLDI